MSEHVSGEFVIDEWKAEDPYDDDGGTHLGHVTLTKTFSGALVGTSEVHMIGAQNPETGTGAYVAIERVHGDLNGRAGSFVLQHTATASPDEQSAKVTVVPGTGTNELAGLTGEFVITRHEDGSHTYTFDYEV
ncbi:Protein of unknown function [Actinokineospora alba]|uniref:DUF3224 domain-containing protein n=1 Tax=Actinokineospora alba TaxID=504798 RepID=A0A1H0K9G8_9PSEU|nr:DUF3224 domain-containing protein [Actinokineospora alba]TDP67997.1 uncharacterized protein DUF3224 [Actinokineospora alba]SDH90426.1 Protein of unknown function [Actinokineospora alba]SDO52361.1 Protein of unknown function [Actinokineospora alba]